MVPASTNRFQGAMSESTRVVQNSQRYQPIPLMTDDRPETDRPANSFERSGASLAVEPRTVITFGRNKQKS